MQDHDPLMDVVPSRYVVGIDLGTTNSAVCYIDTDDSERTIRTLRIPQLVAAGQVEALETLPSFHYQPTEAEMAGGSLKLPWSKTVADHAVGVFAREQGTTTPGRVVASAKSWLCHAGVDRTAELLPWQALEDVVKLSPVEVSARYLSHIRQAWDKQFPEYPLSDQDIVLTLPASFDEVARELTVQAAKQAQLPRIVLIEEPQAAFYAWVDAHSQDWQTQVTPGQKILVCDVGGGTSDFTLIRVRQSQAEADHGAVQFHRVAVGDHLILGGDNLDLALAHYLDQKLGQPLQPRQWDVLVRSCRHVKETLLGDNPPERTTVHLPGSGAKLIGGGLQIEVTRDEAEQVLVEGFFPQVTLEDKPQTKKSGFQEFGLPYASDPAVTKYIAAFLTAHRHVDSSAADSTASDGPDPARPDLILFNGGLFCSPLIQFRIVQAIRNWFKTDQDPTWSPVVLQNDRLDLAVAKGAAYYGMVRRGEGVRIAAGLARSYYVGVANEANQLDHAVCLVPGRTQPGETVDLTQHQFDLRISEPVEFPLFVSSVRLADEPGQALPIDLEQMRPLPPIRTALKSRRRSDVGTVPVQLHARLSEIGTIEMWCAQVDQDRQWRLQFDVRSALETDRAAIASTGEGQGTLDDQTWEECQWLIEETFGDAGKRKPRELVSSLADVLQAERHAWPMSVLRRIWESLLDHQEGRKKSQAHEARWLNLAGYSLRPGYGMAVDDWRVAETWRLVNGKLAFNSPVCRSETWILWRRIAGGLTAGQQKALAEPLLSSVRSLHRRMVGGHVKGDVNFNLPESAEMWRLLGSLEWLPRSTKRDLGEMILELAWKRKCEAVRPAMIWAVGRLGARTPVYGPLNTVVDAAVAEPWIRQLMEHEVDTVSALAAMQLGRRTSDRHRDISDSGRSSLVDWLGAFSPNYAKLVSDVVELNQEQQGQVFGESLPVGLRIR